MITGAAKRMRAGGAKPMYQASLYRLAPRIRTATLLKRGGITAYTGVRYYREAAGQCRSAMAGGISRLTLRTD